MEVLDNFDFDEAPSVSYPWEVWKDGQSRRAVKGVDYVCTTESFLAGLYGHAKRHEQKVRATKDGDSVIFQFQ